MKRQLMQHQQTALEFIQARERAGVFMEMRLGKTLTMIRHLELLPGFHLIVAPKTVLAAWEREFKLENVSYLNLRQVKKENVSGIFKQAETITQENTPVNRITIHSGFVLVNYERLRIQPEILQLKWSSITLDESTKIKNPKAQITKTLLNSCQRIPYRYILSGLPNPEGMEDYFCQCAFLQTPFMGSRNFWEWRSRYFQEGMFHQWFPFHTTQNKIQAALQPLCFVMTRKEAGLGNHKIYETREVEANPEQKRLMKSAKSLFKLDSKETSYMIVVINWLLQLAGGLHPETKQIISDNKLKEIVTLLEGELKGEQVIIWFRHIEEIKYAYQYLRQERGYQAEMMYGGVDTEKRKLFVEAARNGKIQILLCQEDCVKFGLDMSFADTAIYYSNSWSGESRIQSEDRIINPKKEEPLLYLDLQTEGSIDKHILKLLQEKRDRAEGFNQGLILRQLYEEWVND